MRLTKLACPHCHKKIKFSRPLDADHRILCSRCGRSFPAPVAIAAVPPLHEPLAASPNIPSSVNPELANKEMPSPVSNRQLLWLGVALSGLALLLIAAVSLVLHFALHKESSAEPVDMAVVAPPAAEPEPVARQNLPSDAPQTDAPPPPPAPAPRHARRDTTPSLPAPTLEPTHATMAPQQSSWLPSEEQEQVNKAIDRGVAFLQKSQAEDGNWGPRLGLVALPALTLLECGVPADDRHIQKALRRIREAVQNEQRTYDLSLAILFLDRLGDPADKKLIQTCALRLVAGQMASGGWTYMCPILSAKEQDDLLTVMRFRRAKDELDLFVGGVGGSAPPGFQTRERLAPLNKDIQSEPSNNPKPLLKDGMASGHDNPPDKQRPSREEAQLALNRLPGPMWKLPSLQPPRQAHKLPHRDGSDNSNTQFAILGLLAAARHDLPLERTFALIVHRFHASQVPDGRWNYHFTAPARPAELRPAMTGAGLLGLAVQFGLAADHVRDRGKPSRFDDPAVEKGFTYLSQFIGKPIGWKQRRSKGYQSINLYFLWTVERCGVLYHRRQLDGKDWYPWGVELLLAHQEDDGSWNIGGYVAEDSIKPVTDTSFALLFLKRADLAKELTRKLEFFVEGKQLQARP